MVTIPYWWRLSVAGNVSQASSDHSAFHVATAADLGILHRCIPAYLMNDPGMYLMYHVNAVYMDLLVYWQM